MASPAQAAPPQIVDVPLALFGGMHTGVAPADLPEGLSPDNQDVAYVPGENFSRPALSKIFGTPLGGDVPILYTKTYVMPDKTPLTLALNAMGQLFVENVATNPGVASPLAAVTPGVSAFSATAFGREYLAFSDLLTGQWPPLQYDGTNLDRVTQDGPGEPVSCTNVAPSSATVSDATRLNNLVTATTSSAHGFQIGWQVQLTLAEIAIGGGIAAISRDGNGNVTVVTNTAHGLVIGSMVDIEGVTSGAGDSGSFDGIFPVASIVNPTTFIYAQGGIADSTATFSGATVSDVWNTTAFVQSVPSPASFTYNNIGPNDTGTSGTAQVIGQISPGLHNIVSMFLFRSGAISKPSPPFAFYANGAQQMLVEKLPLGNETVVARIIGATGAGGDNYFIIPATPQVGNQVTGTSTVVEDNTSLSVQLDFSDNTLFDSIAIDQPGNDLFEQRVLVAPIGFYSYASRLAAWGDWDTIQNLLNMTLGAGSSYVPATEDAGTGVNGAGSGPSWTNPNNITSASSYADASVTAGQTSKPLLAENFGFAAASPIQAVSAAFRVLLHWRLGHARIAVLLVRPAFAERHSDWRAADHRLEWRESRCRDRSAFGDIEFPRGHPDAGGSQPGSFRF